MIEKTNDFFSDFFSNKKKSFATLIAFLSGVIASLIITWVIFTDLKNLTAKFCLLLFSIVIIVMIICWVLAYIAVDSVTTRRLRLEKLRNIFKDKKIVEVTLKHKLLADAPFQTQALRTIYRCNDISRIFLEYRKNDILKISLKLESDTIYRNVGNIKLENFDDFFELKNQ